MKLALSVLALLLSALPCSAQRPAQLAQREQDLFAAWTLPTHFFAPAERAELQLTFGLGPATPHGTGQAFAAQHRAFTYSLEEELAAFDASGEGARVPFEVAPSAAPAPRAGEVSAALARGDLEGARADALAFEVLPGGIVFGLSGPPPGAFAEVRGEIASGGMRLLLDGRAYALSLPEPLELHSFLRFVARERRGEVLVDILEDGTVLLAPEFVDTPAGALLIRADRLPFEHHRALFSSKSVIVDREAGLTLCDESGRAEPAARIEVRFFRKGRGYLGLSAAEPTRTWHPESPGGDLAGAARIAAWLGFLRWLRTVDVAAFDALRLHAEASLAFAPPEPAPTARRVETRVERSPVRPEERIRPWMRAYRHDAQSPRSAGHDSDR